MLPGAPPKNFCDATVKKVVETMMTFDRRDSAEWRECVAGFVDEACARRYLTALDWMASRAVLALTKTIQWRLNLGLHRKDAATSVGTLNADGASSAASASPREKRSNRGSKGRGQPRGGCRWSEDGDAKPIRVSSVQDAEGRPIVVMSARQWPKNDMLWMNMLIEALEVAAIRLRGEIPRQKVGSSRQGCDRTDERGRAETDEGGGGTRREDTWAWLVDMEGAGPGDAPAWQTLRELDEILFAHYPGRLGKVLIVNASAFLRMSISVVERLVDEKARPKMIIVDGKRETKLERFVPAADLTAILASRQPPPTSGQEEKTVPWNESE